MTSPLYVAHVVLEINDAIEAGTSLTLGDLLPEAVEALRAFYGDDDLPVPDLGEDAATPLDYWLAEHPEFEPWDVLLPEQCALGWHTPTQRTGHVTRDRASASGFRIDFDF